ncbi:MAG: hypothetical protein EOO16_04645 [Chitinophagaceae bacterium]|nr:MAG: hypothetical protein EOO16_04645 [Chitinophagaceae bacterium]
MSDCDRRVKNTMQSAPPATCAICAWIFSAPPVW